MSGSSRRAVLTLVLGLAVAGCDAADAPTAATQPPDAPQPSAASERLSLDLLALLGCRPLPYSSATASIGPAGGELRLGPHRLSVPQGALAAPTVITGHTLGTAVVLVRLEPSGLRFARPARLTLSYAHCGLPPLLGTPAIVQVDDALRLLEVLPSQLLPGRQIAAPLEHFSNYAVAW